MHYKIITYINIKIYISLFFCVLQNLYFIYIMLIKNVNTNLYSRWVVLHPEGIYFLEKSQVFPKDVPEPFSRKLKSSLNSL